MTYSCCIDKEELFRCEFHHSWKLLVRAVTLLVNLKGLEQNIITDFKYDFMLS